MVRVAGVVGGAVLVTVEWTVTVDGSLAVGEEGAETVTVGASLGPERGAMTVDVSLAIGEGGTGTVTLTVGVSLGAEVCAVTVVEVESVSEAVGVLCRSLTAVGHIVQGCFNEQCARQ
jgi:hypothetical protein